jgi:hypothetical protein
MQTGKKEHPRTNSFLEKDYFLLQYTPSRNAAGIPQKGFAMNMNKPALLISILASGVSLPSAVMKAMKNTRIQTVIKIPTASTPRFQFLVISFGSFRICGSVRRLV